MAQLSEIRDRVSLKIGNRQNLNSTIDFNINQAILQVVMEARPKEAQQNTTFTTADGDFDYTIGSGGDIAVTDLYAVEMIRNVTDEWRMARGTLAEFEDQKQTGNAAKGAPHKWFHRGNAIFIYDRVPDSTSRTMRIRYLERPTALADDTDTFPLNDEWLKPVESLATAMTFQDLNSVDKAAFHLSAYREVLSFRESPEMIEDEAPDGQVVMVSNTGLFDEV